MTKEQKKAMLIEALAKSALGLTSHICTEKGEFFFSHLLTYHVDLIKVNEKEEENEFLMGETIYTIVVSPYYCRESFFNKYIEEMADLI